MFTTGFFFKKCTQVQHEYIIWKKKKPKCEQWNVHYVKKMERMKEISNEKNGKNLNEKKKNQKHEKIPHYIMYEVPNMFQPHKRGSLVECFQMNTMRGIYTQ
jgi:hypothetical protein